MSMEFIAWYGTLVCFLFGLCVGSFLNVCIFRIPRGLSIVAPRSFCPGCRNMIAWYDNIPVLSYLVLRGRCRHCRMPVSMRYPLIELLTALLFVGIWNRFLLSPLTLAFCVMTSLMIVAAFVDFEHMIIPDRTSLGCIVLGLAFSVAFPRVQSVDTILDAVIRSLIGVVAGAGALWLVSVIGKWMMKKDAMGLGDVKLLGGIGAFLGLPGVFYTILVSSIIGTVVGLSMIALGGHKWMSRLPYGPYLAAAAVSWVLGGDQLWNLYIKFVTGQ